MALSPVTPRPEQLPLNDPNWSWDRFEAFCHHLISQFAEVRHCYRYGKKGDFQRGIDIVADLDNGERWVFQCKRYKRYTATQTAKAVEEATYPANRYILLLSCEAGGKVRDEIDKHSNWELWDVQNISVRVRNLPIDVARRLVETHFSPEWRKAFLGVTGLTTFVEPEDFFQPLLKAEKLFNHTWSLVGRTEYIEELHKFVESEQRVVILTGRGGIGKTKLLHTFTEEFDNHHPQVALRFLALGLDQISREGLDEIPTEPCVIAVDDAHRCSDLSVLLTFVQQHPQVKLIISSRPQGIDYLHSRLARSGFDSREVLKLESLKELNPKEVKALAQQALGDVHAYHADRLAAITKDCPLITVIGGKLLAQKKIDLQLLERDEEFRNSVLDNFQADLVREVSKYVEPQLCRELLKLFAAVAPIQPEAIEFQQLAAEFLDVKPSLVIDAINTLEKSGVLLRRGYKVRITPDVLADRILHDACLNQEGRPTGYAQLVFEKFSSTYPAQVFRNLAELDWRIHCTSDEATHLLAHVWWNIQEQFENANNFDRYQLLKVLEQVAYYQPEQSLKLVKFVIDNPAQATGDERIDQSCTHGWILSKLPKILEHISYTLDYLPRCCDLLWQIGRDDESRPYSGDAPGISTLTRLAEYDFLHKPLKFNELVVKSVASWMRQSDVHNHIYSPLDIVDPVLSKEAESSQMTEGFMLKIYRRPVVYQETEHIRNQALNIIANCLMSTQVDVALRALVSLEKALKEPRDRNGKRPEDKCKQWITEQLKILELINNLVICTIEPLVYLKVIKILKWHIHNGYSFEVRQKALEIIHLIPNIYRLRLIGLFIDVCTLDWFLNNKGTIECEEWREQIRERIEKSRLTAAQEFLEQYSEACEGTHFLNQELKALMELKVLAKDKIKPEPQWFLETLSAVAEPNYIAEMCEAILTEPESPLSARISTLLLRLRKFDIHHAISVAQRAVDTEDVNFCVSLAEICWTWGDNLQSEDVELIERLVAHNNPAVRNAVISSLHMLGQSHPQLTIRIALDVNIGINAELADTLCGVFNQHEILLKHLTNDELGKLLTKLEPVEDIDAHNISNFIAYAFEHLPHQAIQLLLDRIERKENQDGDYEPLPYDRFQYKLNKVMDNEDILRGIRNRVLASSDSKCFWLPKLFRQASSDFSEKSLSILNEWINSEDVEQLQAAASLLSEIPTSFFFKYTDFIDNLLEKSFELGCLETVSNGLLTSMTMKAKSGIPGEPFPEDLALRDQALAVAAKLDAGSLSHKFYSNLAKLDKDSIQMWQKMCEEEFD